MASANTGVFWVGSDGNIYIKAAGINGVQNAGKAINVGANGFDSSTRSEQGLTQITDPNPQAPKSVAPTVTGASTAASTYDDKSNDIAQQNAGLNAVGGQTSTGQAAVAAALAQIMGEYGDEDTAETNSYKTNSDQNTSNLQKDNETALVNAAQGRQGLNATLASLGALNGSGITLATRAVTKGANEDLSGAADNFATNAQALDSANGAFQAEDKERKDQATTDAANASESVANEGAKDQLGYYQNLSNDYAAEGDSANATKYSNLASALFPTIAATTVPAAGPSYSAASYQAPSLSSYQTGANTAVTATPATAATGGIPGLAATTLKKKATVAA